MAGVPADVAVNVAWSARAQAAALMFAANEQINHYPPVSGHGRATGRGRAAGMHSRGASAGSGAAWLPAQQGPADAGTTTRGLHGLQTTWKCYSAEGAAAAAKSNIHYRTYWCSGSSCTPPALSVTWWWWAAGRGRGGGGRRHPGPAGPCPPPPSRHSARLHAAGGQLVVAPLLDRRAPPVTIVCLAQRGPPSGRGV